jgi:hypothetical protein
MVAGTVSQEPAAFDDPYGFPGEGRFGAVVPTPHKGGRGLFRLAPFGPQIEEESGEFLFGVGMV